MSDSAPTVVTLSWIVRPLVTFSVRLGRVLTSDELRLMADVVEQIEIFREAIDATDGQEP